MGCVGLEDRVEQGAGDLRPDQRIGRERPQGDVAVAGPCCLDRQLFVGLDGLDESSLLGLERGQGERMRAVAIDHRGDLHDRIVRKIR